MRQLLDLKGSSKLPDEVQWSIRMLLPKPGLAAGSVQQAAAVHAGGDGTGIQNALAVLAEHAQQVCAVLKCHHTKQLSHKFFWIESMVVSSWQCVHLAGAIRAVFA